jgi:8-oxo-dGTP diphosphatase
LSNRDPNRKVTEVAVGVIFNADGAFLLAKRPPGKPYADYWEFPGGKLEQGESVHQALERELVEELGILIQGSHAWEIIEHDYPHAYVRLHLLIVKQWQGEVQGLEGQELYWQAQNGNDLAEVSPLLPATITIIQMLRDFNKVS